MAKMDLPGKIIGSPRETLAGAAIRNLCLRFADKPTPCLMEIASVVAAVIG
ncbi:hypothetical protein [Xanthomonas prunicola]|jgi:hypothetical protein|uniref:hypothetical protein n=1 Tax=Xanthomonas prunicola TaxID=2053930 RepID=UPI0013000D47|nr:hypothetical protein [Xanthomonas prunicola]